MITSVHDLRHAAAVYAQWLLWALVPATLGLGLALGTGSWQVPALMAAIAGLVSLQARHDPAGQGVQMGASAGLAVGVAAIVYLLRGHPWQADAHMIFFAAFALTGVFCNWRPIVTYAGVVAVHHLVLNYALTAAVFPGEASLMRVLLHAAVLIVQTVPLIWLATVLARLFDSSERLLHEAQAARLQSEQMAAEQRLERAEAMRAVQDLSTGLAELSDGHLQTVIPDPAGDPFPSRYADLRDRFNHLVGRLNQLVAGVGAGAHGLRRSAGELAGTAEAHSARATLQAETLQRSVASLSQLSGSVRETAGLAQQADKAMATNRAEAEKGGDVLARAVEAMTRIEASSQQIRMISEVIEDIAFQTNLLALNAGVEASRAGEFGRGFAVVATEVRALAGRASASAKDIRSLVSEAQVNVAEGSTLVRSTGNSLGALITGAVGTAEIVASIAQMIRSQADNVAAITKDVATLASTTARSGDEATAASTLSAGLRTEADRLLQAVTEFGVQAIPDRTSAPPRRLRSSAA